MAYLGTAFGAVGCLLVLIGAGPAKADDALAPVGSAESDGPFASLAPLDGDTLTRFRGGIDTLDISVGDVAINQAQQDAVNTNNSVSNSTTGQIDGNTVSELSGVSAVMMNTGNNVNMMSSIQLNVFVD